MQSTSRVVGIMLISIGGIILAIGVGLLLYVSLAELATAHIVTFVLIACIPISLGAITSGVGFWVFKRPQMVQRSRRFCSYCGRELPVSSKFCDGCGKSTT